MTHILALDQGTTGSRAMVFDGTGRVIGHSYQEIPQSFPATGQVEHDANALFDSTVKVARTAIKESGITPDAIGITNQRETVIAWDRDTLKPLAPAIVWQDRRTAPRCVELRDQGLGPMIREHTGLVIDPYFSATKIEWLLRLPAVASAAASNRLAVGTVDSWLITRLTGKHLTDRTNASRTMLANLATCEWDSELLDLFGVDESILPRIVASSGKLATASAEWFGEELPICGVAGDQQAALFGQGAVEPGQAKITFGTGSFLLRFAGTAPPAVPDNGILATVAVAADGGTAWALEGSNFIAGAAVQWLRDGLGIITDAAETAELAASVESSDGVVFVPAFTGLGAPHWDPGARGTIVGLSRGTTRAHLVRATLEAIGQGSADLIEAMGGASELRVDGGAAANDWMMQYLADLLDIPVVRPAAVELTAYGAARLAAIGLGTSLPPAAELGRMTSFEPGRDDGWRKAQRAEWSRAVGATIAWTSH